MSKLVMLRNGMYVPPSMRPELIYPKSVGAVRKCSTCGTETPFEEGIGYPVVCELESGEIKPIFAFFCSFVCLLSKLEKDSIGRC